MSKLGIHFGLGMLIVLAVGYFVGIKYPTLVSGLISKVKGA